MTQTFQQSPQSQLSPDRVVHLRADDLRQMTNPAKTGLNRLISDPNIWAIVFGSEGPKPEDPAATAFVVISGASNIAPRHCQILRQTTGEITVMNLSSEPTAVSFKGPDGWHKIRGQVPTVPDQTKQIKLGAGDVSDAIILSLFLFRGWVPDAAEPKSEVGRYDVTLRDNPRATRAIAELLYRNVSQISVGRSAEGFNTMSSERIGQNHLVLNALSDDRFSVTSKSANGTWASTTGVAWVALPRNDNQVLPGGTMLSLAGVSNLRLPQKNVIDDVEEKRAVLLGDIVDKLMEGRRSGFSIRSDFDRLTAAGKTSNYVEDHADVVIPEGLQDKTEAKVEFVNSKKGLLPWGRVSPAIKVTNTGKNAIYLKDESTGRLRTLNPGAVKIFFEEISLVASTTATETLFKFPKPR